jgi:glycosyltransferase involved in cell wall biosynthesis
MGTFQAPNKVGLVHDYLLTMRGAERTFAAMTDCWPGAPVYTTIYDKDEVGWRFVDHEVQASYLQVLGIGQKGFRRLLPFFPHAIERLPVVDHDMIISSSSAFAHGVRPGPGVVHICYCHSPFRYAWHERARALSEVPYRLRPVINMLLDRIKRWDISAANRVTHYIANSKITQKRIAENYGRDSIVINPPVNIERFGPPQEPENFFLFVGEVVSHKRVDVAIEAAHRAGVKIKIVGDGPERKRLSVKYEATADFLGRVTDKQLDTLYARARALVVPNVEEFGIAAVEAQAAGRPVLAMDRGGTAETVKHGLTGILVRDGSVDEFAEMMATTDFADFDSAHIVIHAQQFSADRFRHEIADFVSSHTTGQLG